MDGTLFDFEATQEIALDITLSELGISSTARYQSKFREANEYVWREFEKGNMSKSDALNHRFEILLDNREDSEATNNRYLSNLGEIKPPLLKGAREIVDWVEKKAGLWFVTNGHSEVQKKKMAISDLRHLRDRVTISDDVGVGKPDAKIFLHAVRAAGFEKLSPSEIIMIGDNLVADIEGASALGFDTVWYDPLNSEVDCPGYRVSCLTEIQSIFE